MPTFAYAAYDAAGTMVEGVIDAADGAAAVELLHRRGLIAFRTDPVSADAPARRAWLPLRRRRPLTIAELADFARQLATLVKAELPLDQCLRLVASQATGSPVGAFAGRLADAIVAGHALSQTFEREAPEAPAFIGPLLRASEARGSLAPGLADLARILEHRVSARARVRSALVYPAILLLVALATVALVVAVLVPTLMPLFKDAGAAPPTGLWLANEVRELMLAHGLALGAGMIALLVATLWLVRKPALRTAFASALLRLPIVGVVIGQGNVAMMARTLGTLLRSGVPLTNALGLTAGVVSSPPFRLSLERATQAVKEGSRLADALARAGVYPDVALRFVTIGEEASKLDDMLLHLADVADSDVARRIDGLLTVLSPAITLLVGVVIGGLILSVMQAILGINDIALK